MLFVNIGAVQLRDEGKSGLMVDYLYGNDCDIFDRNDVHAICDVISFNYHCLAAIFAF